MVVIKKRLPVYLRAVFVFVGVTRFELATPCPPGKCANRAALHPEQTLNLRICTPKCKVNVLTEHYLLDASHRRLYDDPFQDRS